MSTYYTDASYNRAVDQMAKVEPCPVTGKIDPDSFKIILGETLGIFPASIAASVDEDSAKDAKIEARRHLSDLERKCESGY